MPPRLYTLDQHRLGVERFDPDALWIIQKLRKAGFSAFIVGGGVRDHLMGLVPKDIDIATSARPGQVRKHLHNSMLIGRRFRLAHVRFGTKIIEVATFRSGETDGDFLLRDNQWGTAEEDVLRRDFTINGLFYDPFEQNILDYIGGVEDLDARILKTIGDPELRFREDPVRMIRLLKFNARFALNIDKGTYEALRACRTCLRQSSPARVLEELMRMLESGASRPFFDQMLKTELLGAVLPHLQKKLEGACGEQVLALLASVDRYLSLSSAPRLCRQALFCCLLFPILEEQLRHLEARNEKGLLNAADVAHCVRQLMGEVLETFNLFPRKLLAQLTHILQQQYRMQILMERSSKPLRLLRHSEFPLGLEFLAIRSLQNPQLRNQLAVWKGEFERSFKSAPSDEDICI